MQERAGWLACSNSCISCGTHKAFYSDSALSSKELALENWNCMHAKQAGSRQASRQTDSQAPSMSIIDIFNLFWLPIVLMARQTLLQRRKRFAMYRNLITLLSILLALLWKPAAAVPKGHFLVALESMQQFLLDCKWRHFLAALKSRQWFLQPARIPLHMASFFCCPWK